MTHDLHDRIDDLVADAPAYVVPDARAAWAAGARRRTRHRVGVLAAATIVVALLAGAVTWLPRTLDPAPADPDGGPGVDGYPARVVDPWVGRALPDAPGPAAMVYNRDGASWWVADAEGRSWQLPQGDVIDGYPPALSPDGRTVGYFADRTRYSIQDLGTGEVINFRSIGDGADQVPAPQWLLAPQSPGFWSPNGARLLIRVGGVGPDSDSATALVLTRDQTMTEFDDKGFPAGWLDAGTTAWIRAGKNGAVRLVGVDLQGSVQSRVDLALRPKTLTTVGQWSASISPDGSQVAVVDDDGQVLLLSTADGSLIDSRPEDADAACGISWQDGAPVVMSSEALTSTRSGAVTTFDPDVYCALAASAALGGERHPGTSRWWLASSWVRSNGPPVAVGVGLVASIVLLRVIGRRRRTLTPTS